MVREGIGTILGAALGAVILTVGALLNSSVGLTLVATLMWIVTLFAAYFFRDPERHAPNDEGLVLAPADGRIVDVSSVDEELFIKGQATQVAIFLSLFDVHVNRAPITGEIQLFRYKRGRFQPAYKKDAGAGNEHTVIGIEGPFGRVMIRQIAGKVARRIVCYVREGRKVTGGERIGLIRFGSRVDLFLPAPVVVEVSKGDRVRAGETVIGKMRHV